MQYNEFNGEKLSTLGLGLMRLPCVDGKYENIDEAKTAEMIDFSLESGINYFDAAWMYHHGNSEKVAGKLLMRHRRESFLLADKFPGQLAEAVQDPEKTFNTQMERCGCGFFDFYLLHNVNEANLDYYLDDKKYGIVSYLLKQKAAGKFRHFGFSCHCTLATLEKFLDRYADIMEFGQLQLNYLDWHLQNAAAKVELLKKYDLPIWVMEPLRGGKLAEYSPETAGEFAADRSAVETGFNFLQAIPEVKMVLSGMSNMAQLKENIRIFSDPRPLNRVEFDKLTALSAGMIAKLGVPCTKCSYCVSKCPQKLNIPQLLELYNEFKVSEGAWIPKMVIGELPENERPAACVNCRSCEKICPQGIEISRIFGEFTEALKK